MLATAALLAVMLGVLPSLAGPSATGATVESDKLDYAPGETVVLSGAGWAADEPVNILVQADGQAWSNSADVTAGADGAFSYSFELPVWFIAVYNVTATGPVSGTATATFTDGSIGTYDQCSNDDGDGYDSGDTGCRWINGNLQANNSTYFEGDATVQRLWLKDYQPGSTTTVTFQYGTTKGGTHAYDFLTTWDHSENWLSIADRCQDIGGCETATENQFGIPADPNVPAAIPQGGSFTIRGGTITGVSTPALVSGSYAGDSETQITVTITVGSTGALCKEATSGPQPRPILCEVVIWFGAHIAETAEWFAYNGTTGAGDIEGSPYHVALAMVDGGSIGQRDNQMQANAIVAPPQAEIAVSKTAAGTFTRTHSWTIDKSVDPASISMFIGDPAGSADWDVALDKTTTDTNFAVSGQIVISANGTGTADVSNLQDSLAGTVISGCQLEDATPVDPVGGTVTLAAGSSITCDYTASVADATGGNNTASVVADGQTVSSPAVPYTFTPTVAGFDTVNVTDDNQGALGSTSADFTFEYSTSPVCPTDTEMYVNGVYSFDVDNTATITETGASDDATLTVNCYAPVVTKTAAGLYDLRYTWSLTKSVDPESQSGVVGDSLDWTWTVVASATSAQENFRVSGTISVANAHPTAAMTVDVADAFNGTTAVVDCDAVTPGDQSSLTVAAASTGSCSYSGSPTDDDADLNTATATLNGIAFSGTASVSWSQDQSINDSATVDDPTAGIFDEAVTTDGGTFNRSGGAICSTDPADYTDGHYSDSEDNTATLTDELANEISDDATTAWDCYAPIVSKTASGTYDETHTWTIDKTVDPESQDGFIGDVLGWTWTVDVEESSQTSEFAVTGTISVQNPSPDESMTVDVSDLLNDGTVGTVDCDEETPGNQSSLTIAASSTGSCSYTAAPSDDSATLNTATVTLNEVDFSGTAAVSFTANVIGGTATLTDDEIGLDETLTAGAGPWTRTGPGSHTCTEVTSGSVTNTATVTPSEGTADSDDATTAFACHELTVTKTATTSFTRTWDWTIEKVGDQTSLTLTPGQTFVVNYDVTVNTTSTDSDWAVSGTITVNNRAPIAATLTTVADLVSPAIGATVDCGVTFPYVLAAGGTLNCTYSADLPDASDRTNTATATFQNTPGGTTGFSGTAAVSFAEATMAQVDECIDVTDTLGGALGTVCAEDAPKTFEYSYTVGPYEVCGAYTVDNTAAFVAIDTRDTGSDSWTVDVDVPCDGCTLTQGYWKTHSLRGPAPYDEAWLLIGPAGADTPFFASGKTYYEILWMPPSGGNAYLQLAHQYIAAKLNILNGASSTAQVDAAIAYAESFFPGKTPSTSLTKAQQNTLRGYASTLDRYNNGLIGPGHCSEDATSAR